MEKEHKWLICDMHLHSQYSRINKLSEKSRTKDMSAEDFVEILRGKRVNLFSVTDHNYFSKKYFEEINQYIAEKKYDMSIIPGAELDVYILEIDDYIHVCFYFEKTIDLAELEKSINELYRDSEGQMLKPSFEDIINRLNKLMIKYLVIPHGDKGDERGLFNIIKTNGFANINDFYKYSMYKIYNAFDVRKNFLETSSNHWAAAFYNKSKNFNEIVSNINDEDIQRIKHNIVKKINDENYILNENETQIFEYLKKYGSYFAYFNFSDWHNKEEYKPNINNFIFGNLENSFEAFEMSTLDPESRIIQTECEDVLMSNSLLSKVEFDIQNNKKEVNFTPGLNVIVGKRGSGKSLLISVIKNLYKKEAKDGALEKYKNLSISNIKGFDRSGVVISTGGLSSTVFLSQNDIDPIFNDLNNANEKIKGYFKSPNPINMDNLLKVSSIAHNIEEYNEDYKNITTFINSSLKANSYLYNEYKFTTDNKYITNFKNAISELKEAKDKLLLMNLNVHNIDVEIKRVENLMNEYVFMIEKYISIFNAHNERVLEIKKERSINDEQLQINLDAIKEASNIIFKNITIKFSLEKLKYLINHFKFDIPDVSISRKGKYLFVSFYELPLDFKDTIIEKITKSIKYSKHSLEELDSYVCKKSKGLISGHDNISSTYDEYIKSETFNCKYRFYEIVNNTIEYENTVKNLNDLKEYIVNGDLIDLSNSSLGVKSVAYLDMLFDLEQNILVFDQPEDNIDNDYISNYLVPNIKRNKKAKQMIFVTHNPSVAVYGDAFNYIFATNNDDGISYKNYYIDSLNDKDKLMKILEGGRSSFSNRNKKYGDILGEEEYENN